MDASQVTELLNRWRAGDASAGEQAMNLLYPVLRESAAAQLRRAPFNVTLSATELVSEAFVRIVESDAGNWESRRHFFALAARVMRFLIVDLARRRSAEKRGGQIELVPMDIFDVDSAIALDVNWDWVGLDSILIEFERLYPQCSRVVELKFFSGLGLEEIAESCEFSTATVVRHWRFARAWLADRLEGVGSVT
jgi:RNA polymerase sigma factor (TIGR02999 family)